MSALLSFDKSEFWTIDDSRLSLMESCGIIGAFADLSNLRSDLVCYVYKDRSKKAKKAIRKMHDRLLRISAIVESREIDHPGSTSGTEIYDLLIYYVDQMADLAWRNGMKQYSLFWRYWEERLIGRLEVYRTADGLESDDPDDDLDRFDPDEI